MTKEKQIEEMAKAKKCETCTHNAVCQELEEFRDPLGWINTKDEFVCSYYDNGKASEVAREIFEEIEAIKCVGLLPSSWVKQFAELKKKYTESEKGK